MVPNKVKSVFGDACYIYSMPHNTKMFLPSPKLLNIDHCDKERVTCSLQVDITVSDYPSLIIQHCCSIAMPSNNVFLWLV